MALYIRARDNSGRGYNFFIPLSRFVEEFPELDKITGDTGGSDDDPEDTLWDWASAEDLRDDGDTFEDYAEAMSYEIVEQG